MINKFKTAEHQTRNDFIVLKRLTRMAHLFPGIALALVCSGCLALAVGAAGGAAGAVYVMGKLQDELNHSVSTVHKAALAGIKELDLPVLQDKEDKLTASLETEFADGKHVWIDLDTVADSRTRITIRVGLTGDEVRSRRILDAIKKHLSQPASSAARFHHLVSSSVSSQP